MHFIFVVMNNHGEPLLPEKGESLYSPLGPKTPVALFRRLERFESLIELCSAVPLRVWFLRVLGVPLAGVMFGVAWGVIYPRQARHTSGCALLATLPMIFMLPTMGTLAYPVALLRMRSTMHWMKPLTAEAFQQRALWRWLYRGPLQIRPPLPRAILLAVLLSPLNFGLAVLIMLAFSVGVNGTAECPPSVLLDCTWGRAQTAAYFSVLAACLQAITAFPALAGCLLEANLTDAVVLRMFRLQHPESSATPGEKSVAQRNSELVTPE